MKKKGEAGILVIFIIIGAMIIVASKGSLFSTAAVSSDINTCKFAIPQFITISCSPSGNPVPYYVNATSGGTRFTVNTMNSYISGSTADASAYQLLDSNGIWICGTKYGTQQYGFPSACNNVRLDTGKTYVYKKNNEYLTLGYNQESTLTYMGEVLYLKLSDSNGQNQVKLAGTQNCLYNMIFTQSPDQSSYGTPYAPVPSNDIKTQLDKVGNSLINSKTVDSSIKSVSLQMGDSVALPSGYYKEIPKLITVNYNGHPGKCDRSLRQISGFTKKIALDGGCYLLEDSGNILYDGSNDAYFACSDADCQVFGGLSSDYIFANFHCTKKSLVTAEQRPDCYLDSDCAAGIQYITDQNGNVVKRTQHCISGKCANPTDEIIGCNPSLAYANNKCCQKDYLGKYSLQECKVNLKDCSQIGATSCCLEGQSEYTIKAAPNGKYCCEIPKDGKIGKVTENKAECETLRGDNVGANCFLGLCNIKFPDLFGGLFGGLQTFGIWIVVVLLIIAAIVFGSKKK